MPRQVKKLLKECNSESPACSMETINVYIFNSKDPDKTAEMRKLIRNFILISIYIFMIGYLYVRFDINFDYLLPPHTLYSTLSHRVGGNQKHNTIEEHTSKTNRNSVFDCNSSPTGDKWQSKTWFHSIFVSRSSIVDNFFNCRLSGVIMHICSSSSDV